MRWPSSGAGSGGAPERIERDVADGVLASGTDASALSGLVMAVIQGMSVLARDDVPRASLLATARAALDAWPAA